VEVVVPLDATLGDVAEWVGTISGMALYIAEEVDALDGAAAVDDVDQLVALYASVAGEAADLRAILEGREGLRPAPLGRLKAHQFEQLLRTSGRALALILSKAASANKRLEDNGLLIGGKLDNTPVLNPVVRYLAAIYRKALRQAQRHAQYVLWAGADEDELRDPAQVLIMGGDD